MEVYRVLLVDDEMPALRMMRAIIEKHASGFVITDAVLSGEAALAYLEAKPVDLLLTDISMPGINGITLALEARKLYPDIHIVIISGYAEFEYAKGAIQAAVDDYILKPVNIEHVAQVLEKIRLALIEKLAGKAPALLSSLMSGQPYDQTLLIRLYGEEKYWFALLRWGNLQFSYGELHNTSYVPLPDAPFAALYGRDENEQVFHSKPGVAPSEFQSAVKVYAAKSKLASWTVVFSRGVTSFSLFPDFFMRACQMMERSVVIGRRQVVFLSSGDTKEAFPQHLSNTSLKKLETYIRDGNTKMIRDFLASLAVDWEKTQLPQIHAQVMVHQIVLSTLSVRPSANLQQDRIQREALELLRYANSYGDLMVGLYSLLFDESVFKDKKLNPIDFYNYAIYYIQEKYSEPISFQSLCTEIGISQTYMSRLFRKYGDTSFSSYLTKCRINSATAMIREHPEMPLANVAYSVGYENYTYFCKVFRQIVGCAPSQFSMPDQTTAEEKNKR